jgi:toxin ParE1/3/4
MVKVVWTQRALLDLEGIGEYISKDSEKYARLTLEKIIDCAAIIEETPLVGRIVPESNDKSIREIIRGNYRIIYQIRDKKAVYILTVFHGARLLTKKNLSKKGQEFNVKLR